MRTSIDSSLISISIPADSKVSSIGAEAGGETAGGPLWSRFFSSFAGAGADGDTESVVSDSQAPTSSLAPQTPGALPVAPRHLRHDSQFGNGSTSPSEIHPNDSASVMNDEDEVTSDLVGPNLARHNGKNSSTVLSAAVLPAAMPIDDGTYLFKFLSPSGTTHRFVARYDNYSTVRDIINGKLASDPFFVQDKATKVIETGAVVDPTDFVINYTDDDGDLVLLGSDHDLEDGVRTARMQGKDRVLLVIKGGKGWENATATSAELQKTESSKSAMLKVVQEEDDDDDQKTKVDADETDYMNATSKRKLNHIKATTHQEELVFGFLQKDMVLPAAIAFLGITVIGVFALSRPSSK